jgi:hypothetical protein
MKKPIKGCCVYAASFTIYWLLPGVTIKHQNNKIMSLLSDEYCTNFLEKILFSASQEGVKRIIDVTIKDLEQRKAGTYIIASFVDKITIELDSLNPMNKDAQQWSNIKIARIQFFRIKRNLESTIQ